MAGVLVNCGCAAAMAVWTSPYAIIALLYLACLVLPPGMAGVQAFQLAVTPDELQGRVAGAAGLLTTALAPLATLAAGLLVDQPWHLAVAPFLLAICLSAVLATASPDVRRLGSPL